MQRRDKFAQMPPQKFKRHFYGEKLVALVCLARRAQRLLAAPVKPGSQRRENNFIFVQRDFSAAFEIQADFDAARMKGFSPVEFAAGSFEVVPFEARARVRHAAMQMPPALANRAPRRAFAKCGHAAVFSVVAIFNLPPARFWHGDNVPFFHQRATILSSLEQKMAGANRGQSCQHFRQPQSRLPGPRIIYLPKRPPTPCLSLSRPEPPNFSAPLPRSVALLETALRVAVVIS